MTNNNTFDFAFNSFETTNPESGFRADFGNSYVFTMEPTSPDQRIIKLDLNGMRWYVNPDGTINNTTDPKYNMLRLVEFYHRFKLYQNFKFPHPVYGEMTVKFNKPLIEPKSIPGGSGVLETVQIELIEVPS